MNVFDAEILALNRKLESYNFVEQHYLSVKPLVNNSKQGQLVEIISKDEAQKANTFNNLVC